MLRTWEWLLNSLLFTTHLTLNMYIISHITTLCYKSSCKWHPHGSVLFNWWMLMIKKLRDSHTCLNINRVRNDMASIEWIVEKIQPWIGSDVTVQCNIKREGHPYISWRFWRITSYDSFIVWNNFQTQSRKHCQVWSCEQTIILKKLCFLFCIITRFFKWMLTAHWIGWDFFERKAQGCSFDSCCSWW